MTPEDDEFNRIERESDMRLRAVSAALKGHREHMETYKTPPTTWVGLSMKDMPDKWMGNRQFIAGAEWAAKQLKARNK